MIPLKLSVRNFLCYREDVPSLDFAGMHVACLCGSNGHGKSALLDAITWGVWGKARGRSQDELISYGADESRVELEFLSRGSQFRVIRSHSRGRSRGRPGSTDLQLQILGDGSAQSVSGNTVRETQAKIEQLVGMDYETFINSAFLMQGRADEFTSKTPAERKAVLAAVLGLEVYDRLQGRARERLAENRAAADRNEGSLQQIQREIGEIGDPSGELAGIGRYLETVETQLAEQRILSDSIRNRVTELGRQRDEMAELDRQIQSSRRDLAQLESRISGAQPRIQQYQALVQQAPAIEAGLQRLREARRQFDALEQSRLRFDSLSQEQAKLAQAIADQRGRRETRLEQLTQRIEQELAPIARAEAELVREIGEVHQGLEKLSQQEQAIAQQRSQQQDLATRIGEHQSLSERHRLEGLEIRQKLDLLQDTSNTAAACPLCGNPLGLDGCQRLAETYRENIEAKRSLFRENQLQLKRLESQQATLAESLIQREADWSRSQRDTQVMLRDLERRLVESRQAQQELQRLEPELKAAAASLESGAFAASENLRLQELATELESLAYDEADRQRYYAETRQLQVFEGQQLQLSQARERLPEEEESLAQDQEMLERRRQELAAQEGRLKTSNAALADLPNLETQQVEAQRTLSDLGNRREAAIGRQGYLDGQVRRLAELGEVVAATASLMRTLEEEQGIFQELVTAFGKQGVQAMLIETVVPRLEDEANALLGRMTDNRMHLKLETQRERRTGRGDPIETLEINVSDELGPRSYEMYSGGEAFRVNLALRIALSKVLAQRMGAPLPTLFIDEGFGTQDAAGRERILDVISAIQDDFDKIIVITHLDDLKDMFPVRIEVQKDGNGSTFWLS
jgi:exonuclease SbcC